MDMKRRIRNEASDVESEKDILVLIKCGCSRHLSNSKFISQVYLVTFTCLRRNRSQYTETLMFVCIAAEQ